jgi:transglutaminase-like putative cysteine protease
MQYKITHTTAYQYSTPVSVCHNLVMLTPREDSRIQIHHHRLTTQPTPQFTARRKDAFGNVVNAFSIEENHRQLTITATNRVTVADQTLPQDEVSPPWQLVRDGVAGQSDPNWIDCSRFLFDSPRITRNPEFVDYAGHAFSPSRPVLGSLRDLTTRLYRDFKYD